MIIIHPLKIAFQNTPKVATTSIFNWIYTLLYKKEFEGKKEKGTYIHGWFKSQNNEIIENVALNEFKCPEGYLSFCLIRDPVKRLLSAYSNRVLYHNELVLLSPKASPIIDSGLAIRPSLGCFIEHFEK